MTTPRMRRPLDRRTSAVLERLGWGEAAARGELSSQQKSAAVAALHDAWVAGEIPGFPADDHHLMLAQRHVLRMGEIEAKARARRSDAHR